MSFFRNKTNDSNRIGSIPFNFFEIQINHLHINGKSSTIDWLHNKLKKIEEFSKNLNFQECSFGKRLLIIYLLITESKKTSMPAL